MLALATLLLLTAPTAEAKGKPGRKSKKTEAAAEKADTTKKEKKGYEELLKGAVTDKGMFDVHRKGTDFLFEIPDSLMGRDILIVNKISGVPYALNDAGVNKGMGYGEKIVRFRKDTLYKKVWVMTCDPRITSPEGDRITRSVRDNYRETAIEQFPIDAYGKDSASVVIKVNKVFDGSEKSFNNVFGSIGLPGSPKKDLSKIESVKSFPENIIVKSLLSTSHTEEGTTIPLTVEITSNLVLLAREPMRPRFSDDRVGYFEIGHLYFNDEQQKAEERAFINRWRLEPKPEDVERYKKGELVEPQKPIELWIDPATPPVWVPYIKKGIVEWQEAFEAAGFKNAIVAREVTPDDREFDIDDVRYSVVTYAASEMANAMGPSVIDPRSGEIIEADIIWWHNVMSILHAWIRLQTGAVDPAARGNTLPTEVMGNAVRFVSSHELGHSLGLKHNFGASYSVPVDSLRSKSYTATNGTASSIMDYARFNYVAQPEDGITQLTPKIGTYDKHAINWGYRWLDVKDPHEELPTLNAWLREHENDPEYWYGEQSREGIDPRSQSEDLSNDAVLASTYGLKNLRRIIPHVTDWTSEEGKLQYEGGRLLMAIVFQWLAYADHVKTNVGGFYLNNVVAGHDIDRYVPVPADYQRKSVKYLIDEVFTTPRMAVRRQGVGQGLCAAIVARGTDGIRPLQLRARTPVQDLLRTAGRPAAGPHVRGRGAAGARGEDLHARADDGRHHTRRLHPPRRPLALDLGTDEPEELRRRADRLVEPDDGEDHQAGIDAPRPRARRARMRLLADAGRSRAEPRTAAETRGDRLAHGAQLRHDAARERNHVGQTG